MADSVVSLNFGQGVDTKTDPKMVAPAKLTALQNGIFTNAMRLTKRPGYTSMSMNIIGGGTITAPTMTKSYQNQLTVAGTASGASVFGQRLFSYSPDLNAWAQCGKYVSAKTTKQIIAAPQIGPSDTDPVGYLGVVNSSSAVASDLILYGYDNAEDTLGAFSASPVNWAIYDIESGAQLAASQIISAYGSTWGFSKVVTLGASQFAIFYISDTSSVTPTAPELFLQTITLTSSGVVMGTETLVTPAFKSTALSNGIISYAYDVVSTPGGCIVAASAPNGSDHEVYIATYNTSGVFVNSTTETTATSTAVVINIVLDPTSTNAWIYWGLGSAGDIVYAIFNASTLASVLIKTLITTGISTLNHVTALAISSTVQTVYWSAWTQPAQSLTIGVYYPIISQASVNSTGTVGSITTFKAGLDIYGKPFSFNSSAYLPCVCLSQSQSTGFIIDVNDGIAAAKFLQTEAEGIYSSLGNPAGSTYAAPTPVSSRYPGFLNPMISFSSTLAGFASGFVVSLATVVAPPSATNEAAYPNLLTVFAQIGIALIQFDFDNIDAYQGIIQQDTLVLNGAIVSQFDGAQVTELGFNIDPDSASVGPASGSGGLGTGTYIYYVTYSWTDANGNLHQSAPSLAVSIVFASGTTNNVDIGIAPLNLTQKTNVTINFWRTIADGQIAYLVGSLINSSTYAIKLGDTITDADLIFQPQLYTEGGAILENIAPPPAMIMWTNINRLWVIDSESPETNIEPSKTASPGSGIQFSTGQLTVVIDSRAGEITGASPMDEKTVILKESGLGYFIGDAANDAGNGETINGFQFVPYDTGCINSKSVVLYPEGVIFKSPKGLYQINRGAQVFYFGPEVQQYNAQDIQSAILTGLTNQIRFLTSNGTSLLYDYVFKQWSTFTNHAGLSATIWNNLYIYVRSSNNAQDNEAVFQENLTSYLDNATPYALTAQTAWIKASSAQNFERVKEFEILGDYSAANGDNTYSAQFSFAYDFVSDFTAADAFPLVSTGGTITPFQERVFTPRQKCNAIQVFFQDLPTGAAGEYVDFSDLGMEISQKQGLNKLPASRSTG